jgi:DNA-binding MarR family transcriptional regulator
VFMADDLLHDDRITLWGLFREAHEGLTRLLAQELHAELGIPSHWLEVLLRVGRTPGQAVRMTDLAERVLFTSGGFTKLADRMVQAGLIQRTPCPDDRRSSLITITEDGHRLIDRALAVHVPGIQRYLIDPLDTEERHQLEHILRKLRGRVSHPDSHTLERQPSHIP